MTDGLPECTGRQGHDWRTLKAMVAGYGHATTLVQERCHNCGIIRLNPNREVYVPDNSGGYKRPHDA